MSSTTRSPGSNGASWASGDQSRPPPCSVSRAVFVTITGALLVAALVLLVARPAVERGGWSELVIIAAIFAGVLLIERRLR